MSKWFNTTWHRPGCTSRIFSPYDLNQILSEWDQLRITMIKSVPSDFSRDEWAYLITFLQKNQLRSHLTNAFGEQNNHHEGTPNIVLRPRGQVGLWLPNNVSLLGPLMMILVSLTGNKLRVKKGSNSTDLAGAFLHYLTSNLADGTLTNYVNEQVSVEYFPRLDPKQDELSAESDVRVVFGSDESALAIHALPHKPESTSISFVNRKSEAWISPGKADDAMLTNLLKVFAIYGKAGCTSPTRLVLLDHTLKQAEQVRDRLCQLSGKVLGKVEMYRASENVMSHQWASANGWDSRLAFQNSSCFATGCNDLPAFEGFYSLPIVTSDLNSAIANLPANIQTLGVAVDNQYMSRIVEFSGIAKFKRLVPIGQMHHFGTVWDGIDFLPQFFESVEVKT